MYPGDKITSSWHLDEQTNEWFDSWSVVPGKTGTLNGEHAYEGNYTFDGSKYGMLNVFRQSETLPNIFIRSQSSRYGRSITTS